MSWTQTTTSWPLPAKADAVWHAITDGAALPAWFAEHAQVALTVGGAYRFWGKYTLGAPTAAEATQRITELVPGERLGFTWTVMGVESTVVLRVVVAGDTTKIAVEQTFARDLRAPRQQSLVDDFWRLSFGNLTTHLSGGSGLMRPDFTDTAPAIKLSVVINAPRESVFRALMDPALVNQWTGSTRAVIDATAGTYSYGWEYEVEGKKVKGGPTRILELVPNERLVLDWPDWRGDETVTGQTIAFTLSSEGAATRVDFVHAGFTRAADISDYPFGWGHFLAEIGRVSRESAVRA